MRVPWLWCSSLLFRGASGGLQLPDWLRCAQRELPAVDFGLAVQDLVSKAVPGVIDRETTDWVDSGCALQQLHSRSVARPLFHLIAQDPSLSLLLADLGRLSLSEESPSSGFDLVLDPWLQEHCEESSRSSAPVAWCKASSFDEAVAGQTKLWSALAASMYARLQPDPAGLSVCMRDVVDEDTPLLMAAVGSHSGLSLGVSAAVQAALAEQPGQGQLRLAYFGHWAWCQNVDNCEEPLAMMFRDYQQDWAETEMAINEERYEKLVAELKEFLHGSGAPDDLVRADLLLCTRPFLFCWLLRQLWPEHLRALPMLHYYSGPLLFDTTPLYMQKVLGAFRQTVRQSALDLVVSSSALQSAWMLAMAGTAVPHVRPHATQLRGLYKPPRDQVTSVMRRALVLRSTWVGSLMGDSFRKVLADLLASNGLQGSIELEWLTAGKFLGYQEIASFDAAVFFPEQPDKLTFWEQYEMAMPLWLPSVDFWARIHAIGEFRYSVFASKWFAELPEGALAASEEGCALPQPLFFRSSELARLQEDSPMAPAFWFHLTDYAIFPHLQLFGSAADFVRQVLAADLVSISFNMAAFNDATWQRSAAFYRAAVCALRAPTGGEDVAMTPRFLEQPERPSDWRRLCHSTVL